MSYKIAVTALAFSTFAFAAAAQKPSELRLGPLRVADNKQCPSLHVSMPAHKVSRDELDNKLDKKIKWKPECVAHYVGTYNKSLDDLKDRINSPKCDPKLTQNNVETWFKDYLRSYENAAKSLCVAK